MAARVAGSAGLAGSIPYVSIAIPDGWESSAIAPPPLAESAGATITSWQAARSLDDSAALVAGCVATPIPGWVAEMRPAIEGRTVALAGAATTRITGVPMDLRAGVDPRGNGPFFLVRAASDLDGPVLGYAQTFLGFDGSRVFTCVATCSARRSNTAEASQRERCLEVIAAARLEGSVAPPRPGVGLRGATWAIHHPREAALGGGLLLVMAAVIAITTRRRARFRAS